MSVLAAIAVFALAAVVLTDSLHVFQLAGMVVLVSNALIVM
jgi:hypothetical protein